MPGGAPADGGGDAATSTGGSPSDGSVGAGGGGPSADAGTPGVIECAGTPCTIAGFPTNICCYGGLTTSCLPSFPGCANFGSPIACDDSADCEGGQVCCGGLPLGFSCVASCTSGVQLCRTDDECGSGHTCQPLTNPAGYSGCM